MRPCGNCEKSGLECRKSEHSKKCGNCVKRGYRCDTAPLSSDEVSRYLLEHDRLETEEQRTEERMRQEMSAVQSSMAKLERLRKQKKLLSSRADEMIRRGVVNLEELEKLEEEERQASVEQSSTAATPGSSTIATVFPSGLDFSAALSPGAQARLDVEFAQFFAGPGGSV